MDAIYETDIRIVESLQARFHDYSGILCTISNICDPRYAYLCYVPLVFALDWRIGKKLMWAVVTAEWTNHLLKWLLQGERPYWWVHEAEVYNRTHSPIPSIHQFPLTCETGPGNPSGHSQVAAAVWYVIFDSFLHSKKIENTNGLVPLLCWAVYLAMLAAVSVSRIFIAAHFPHQCFFGVTFGWFLAWKLRKIHKKDFTTLQYCTVAGSMFISAVSIYGFLNVLGSNPMWTVSRATKWCSKSEYVHLESTPFFSMVRYCGYFLGMGFGFNSNSFRKFAKQKFTLPMKTVLFCLSVTMNIVSDVMALPKENLFLFYVQGFLLYVLRSYMSVAVIPNVVTIILQTDKKVE